MRKLVVILLTMVTISLSGYSVFAESPAKTPENQGNKKENAVTQISQDVVDLSTPQGTTQEKTEAVLDSTESAPTESAPTVSAPAESAPVVSTPTESMSTQSMTTTATVTGSYGLIPNDISQKDLNANLLNRALNKYGSITLSGKYYIGNTTVKVTNPNIVIMGLNDTELIFNNTKTNSTVLFDPELLKSLAISNIKFTNMTGDKPVTLAYNSSERVSSKINSVRIEGCTFQGNIAAFSEQGSQTLNPETDDFGIGQFIFTNNKVYDTELSFIELIDVPFDRVEISNNIVNNFQNVFASLGISNGITYEAQMVKDRKLVEINHNTVTCDDDWWAKPGAGTYYAFALTENEEVIFDSNHIEGMKADFDVALYDAYLSSNFVTYTNNTWINNICFDENKTDNTLIKAKQGGIGNEAGDAVVVEKRYYANNTFIVEESFAERLGQPKSGLFVYFMQLTASAKNYTIENNTFDVYDLRFPVSSRQIENFAFNNNNVKSKYILGRLAIVKLTDDCKPTININGNNIQVEQKGVHPTGDTSGFRLVQIVDGRTNSASGLVKSIVVKDNVIHAPVRVFFYQALADQIIVQNNQFTVDASVYSRFVYQGNHPELATIPVLKY